MGGRAARRGRRAQLAPSLRGGSPGAARGHAAAAARGIAPGYEQKHFDATSKRGRLRLVASPDGRDGSVTIHQDAYLYAALLDGGERAAYALPKGRRAYVHVARGSLTANGNQLGAGDALKVSDVAEIVLERGEQAEVLLFDLA